MSYRCHYRSPLGGITMGSDGEALSVLVFDEETIFHEVMGGLGRWEPAGSAGRPGNEKKVLTEGEKNSLPNDGKPALPSGDEVGEGLAACELVTAGDLPVFAETVRWLDTYFGGNEPGFTPKLAPRGTAFRREVWEILQTIPYGRTVTYGQIARRLAESRGIERMSAQAVGGAVGHNPISLMIPCHRVIGSDGSLTGYAGGIWRKSALLRMEGLEPD